MFKLMALVVAGATACSFVAGFGPSPSSSSSPSLAQNAEPAGPAKPEFAKSSQELAQQIALATNGFTPEGPPLHRSLAGFEPVAVVFTRDRYYTITLTLDPGAAFSDEARRRGVHFLIEHGRDSTMHYPGVIGPGGFIGGDNVQTRKLTSNYKKPMEATFDLQFDGLSQDRYQHPAQLGTGGVVVQVLSRTIAKRDHDDDVHAEEASNKAWNDERTNMKTQMCDRCERDYNMCRVSAGESHCATKYKYCAAPARELEQPTWSWCGRSAP